jgi:hypothetical protein
MRRLSRDNHHWRRKCNNYYWRISRDHHYWRSSISLADYPY